MIFEVIKNGLDFWASPQKKMLPRSYELLFLFGMRVSEDEGSLRFPEMFFHYSGSVTGVTHRYFCFVVGNERKHLGIMNIRRSESDATQIAFQVYTGMEFESIVPALMIFAKMSNIPGYCVGISSNEFTDFKHGGINQAEWLRGTQQLRQELIQQRHDPMTVLNKF